MAKKKKKTTETKGYNKEVNSRHCKTCPRWKLFAKDVYLDSGELCSMDTCVNKELIAKPTTNNPGIPLSCWDYDPNARIKIKDGIVFVLGCDDDNLND